MAQPVEQHVAAVVAYSHVSAVGAVHENQSAARCLEVAASKGGGGDGETQKREREIKIGCLKSKQET